jgi:hypothetical protein
MRSLSKIVGIVLSIIFCCILLAGCEDDLSPVITEIIIFNTVFAGDNPSGIRVIVHMQNANALTIWYNDRNIRDPAIKLDFSTSAYNNLSDFWHNDSVAYWFTNLEPDRTYYFWFQAEISGRDRFNGTSIIHGPETASFSRIP